MSIDDERAEIIAKHADYVSGGFRYCTCGFWSDQRPDGIPQTTRIEFAHHLMSQLAVHGYVVDKL